MRDAGGYSIVTEPGARPVESDLTNCAHCNAVQFVKAGFGPPQILVYRADGTHYLHEARRCLNCYRYVCPRSECNKDCVPFELKLDREEAAARRFFCA